MPNSVRLKPFETTLQPWQELPSSTVTPSHHSDTMERVDAKQLEDARIFHSIESHPFSLFKTPIFKPQLEKPEAQQEATIKRAMRDLMLLGHNADEDLDTNANESLNHARKEHILLKDLVFALKNQKDMQEKLGTIVQELVLHNAKVNRELNKSLQEIWEKRIDGANAIKTVAWVDTGLTVLSVAGGIGCVLALIFTGGAALPIIAGAIGAAASISKGGTEIAKGVIEHDNKKAERQFTEEKAKMEMNSVHIDQWLKEGERSWQKVASHVEMWHSVLKMVQESNKMEV